MLIFVGVAAGKKVLERHLVLATAGRHAEMVVSVAVGAHVVVPVMLDAKIHVWIANVN